MEAGPSQAATMAQVLLRELPRKERKPRHKLKKGKEREEDGHGPLAPIEDTGLSKATLGKGAIAEETSAWEWTSLVDTSVSNRPPVFTRDCRCVFAL